MCGSVRSCLQCVAATLVAVALSGAWAAAPAAPPTVTERYQDLLALFAEWRAFQRPAMADGVPDYTPAATARQQARLPEFRGRLEAIRPEGWPVSRRIDWRLVRAEMNGLDFDLRVLRPWARYPGFYAPIVAEQSDTPAKEGPAFAGALELWRHSLPPSAESAAALRLTLRAIPRILDQARGNLVEDARDLWLIGIRDHEGQSAALGDLARRLGPDPAGLLPDVERARRAEDEFVAWLRSKLPEKHGPSGVGLENYDWYLRNVHLLPHTWADEVALMERELGRSLAHLALEENRNRDLPRLEPLATPEEWRRRMDAAVSDYLRFLREKRVVTVDDTMDPALRTRVPAFVAPSERDFFAQVDAREPLLLRCHGYHWFDLARLERHPHPSPIRSAPLLYNIWDSRAEGLATAMEEMMASAGLYEGRPRSRELVYVMIAQRAARALAALRMHANQTTFEEARRFAHEQTPYGWLKLDGELVWFEQALYLAQPGYGSSYLGGKAAIEELLGERARQLGAEFTLQRFMDELGAAGPIPVSMIRWELTGRDDEVRRLE